MTLLAELRAAAEAEWLDLWTTGRTAAKEQLCRQGSGRPTLLSIVRTSPIPGC
jgi:hypothetical protein